MIEINYISDIIKSGITHKYKQKNNPKSKYYVFGNAINKDSDLKNYLFKMGFEIDDYHYLWLKEGFYELGQDIDFNSFKSLDKLRKVLNNHQFNNIQEEVYTAELTKWLASKISRVEYLSLAIQNNSINGFDALQVAQLLEKREVFEMAKGILLYKIKIIKGDVE